MALYKYQPLDLDGPYIRLLRLFKGSFTEDIQCELFEGRIGLPEDSMPYEALSYTWGSSGKDAQILVNGHFMQVTSNLYAVLQHIRSKDEDRVLWIDAICIDQDSNDERQHQVQQMSHIYKGAEEVLVWLGEGTKQTDLVMGVMKQLHLDKGEVYGDWRHLARFRTRTRRDGSTVESVDLAQSDLLKGMRELLGRAWFRRIWVIQEIANARVARVLCGNKSVSARVFAQVPSFLGIQPNSHCQAVLDIMPGFTRNESWWGEKRDLLTLLSKFGTSEATDERDIIYALLGISSDTFASNILLPNYKKSLTEVIRETTSFLLFHTKQDESYSCLDWTLTKFLSSLQSLGHKVFLEASRNGQAPLVRRLLTKDGVDLQLALQCAASSGHDQIVRLLIEHGADLESKAENDRTLLMQEVIHDNIIAAQVLIHHGAELEAKDITGRTPLSLAISYGYKAQVQMLLAEGADIDSKDGNGLTPLLLAIMSEQPDITQVLLEKGAGLEIKDWQGRTALSLAAFRGHATSTQLLLDKGADVNSKDILGRTPLSWAVCEGHEAIAEMLLFNGANLESRDNDGRTPLSWAVVNGHEAIAEVLISNGANLESKDRDGRTPLFLATSRGLTAMMRMLLENSAELDSKDVNGRTPLAWAAFNGYKDTTDILLYAGANLESKDSDGRTPLLLAACYGHTANAQLLLYKGADINSKDTLGRTPLAWALCIEQEQIAELLRSHGAKL